MTSESDGLLTSSSLRPSVHRSAAPGPATAAFGAIAARTDPIRFMSGAELAERAKVTLLRIEPGRCSGQVRGSRNVPYEVELRTPVQGTLPDHDATVSFNCTCPDWGNPCKHAVAVALVLGEQLDDNAEMLTTFIGLRSTYGSLRTIEVHIDDQVQPTLARSETRPTWAEGLVRPLPPTTADAFFGTSPVSVPAPDEPVVEVHAATLGPLVIAGFDLAPDIVRLLTSR
jgi:SWIM zinc finger